MKFQGFVGGSYTSRAVTFDAQRCINLYPEVDESLHGKDGQVAFLYGTPGLSLKATLPNGPGRAGGMYCTASGRLFCVSGQTLYEVNSDWSYSAKGALNTASGPVCMVDNGRQLAIVDGEFGYVYTFSSDMFATITDPDMPKANRCAFLDQYVIYNQIGSSKFYWSALLDASSVDSLDFASAEGDPDLINSLDVLHRQLWIFGDRSVEVWMDSGSENTFDRIDGVFIEIGCIAPQSVQKLANTVFWLGAGNAGHGIVWSAIGLQPKRVSTHAVEYALSKAGDLTQAAAWCYTEGGHQFYVLNVPGSDTSWVYDVSNGLWHERAYWNAGVYERHVASAHAFFNDSHVVNDYRNGNIYVLDNSARDDNGNPIRWLRSSPFMSNSLYRMFHHRFQVDIQAGVGLQAGQGSSPTVMMRYSNDGGRTWSPERTAGIGPMGNYTFRCFWNALGMSRTRAYEISGTDPVEIAILNAETEVEQGFN